MEKNEMNKREEETQNLFKVASQEIEEESRINSFSDAVKELNEEDNNHISFESLLHNTEESNTPDSGLKDDSNTMDLNEILKQDTKDNKTFGLNGLKEQVQKNINLETENTKKSQEENPFIQSELSVEPVVSTTEVEENPKEIKEENILKEPEYNPFVQSEESEEPVISTTEIEENPKEIKEENTLKEPEYNPFVQSEESEEPVISTTEIEENPKEIKEKNTLESWEENPFFANQTFVEENKIDINPFFQNGIELNEKQKYQNKNKLDLSNVPHYHVKIQKKKPKKLKMVLGILSYAVFIWLLLIGITLLIYVANIKIKEMKGDYTPPKYNAYVVLTGSMLPQIKVEDVVVTKKVDAEKLEEGDIITFASSDERYYGTIITHRIKKKYYDSTTGKYTFQSKGDNNNVADPALVEEDNIYGKVILKIPKLGYLQVFLASKGGWILVILIPCAVVISFDIMKLFKMMIQKRKLKIVK